MNSKRDWVSESTCRYRWEWAEKQELGIVTIPYKNNDLLSLSAMVTKYVLATFLDHLGSLLTAARLCSSRNHPVYLLLSLSEEDALKGSPHCSLSVVY